MKSLNINDVEISLAHVDNPMGVRDIFLASGNASWHRWTGRSLGLIQFLLSQSPIRNADCHPISRMDVVLRTLPGRNRHTHNEDVFVPQYDVMMRLVFDGDGLLLSHRHARQYREE
jgi:hypothetical protein